MHKQSSTSRGRARATKLLPGSSIFRVAAYRSLFLGAACLPPVTLPILLLLIAAAPAALTQSTAKTVEGKVFDAGQTALSGSIIYLQDQKTNIVKTYIAAADGSYRFGQLPADTDYKVWAEYKSAKSKSKLISSFDTKLIVTIDFHIEK